MVAAGCVLLDQQLRALPRIARDPESSPVGYAHRRVVADIVALYCGCQRGEMARAGTGGTRPRRTALARLDQRDPCVSPSIPRLRPGQEPCPDAARAAQPADVGYQS